MPVRHQSLLILATRTDAEAVFDYPTSEDEEPGPTLCLPVERWRDLGSPDTITLTIDRYDLLNDGADCE